MKKIVNVPVLFVVVLLCFASAYFLYSQNGYTLFLLLLLIFFSIDYLYEFLVGKYKIDCKPIFILPLTISILFALISIFYFYSNNVEYTSNGFKSICYLDHYVFRCKTNDYVCYFNTFDETNRLSDSFKIKGKFNEKLLENKPYFVSTYGNGCYIISDIPTTVILEKYKYPVRFVCDSIELGNDSYEYAKYERDVVYNNFGLNIVQTATPRDSNIIEFTKLNGEKYYIRKKNNGFDTFLVYSNINPKFFDGWHVCPDNICTSENFAKIEEGGYGYIFRGKVYSKDETEKYWNIIEQYKLREGVKKE